MNIDVERGLAFVSVTLTHQGKTLKLAKVLLDTGQQQRLSRLTRLKTLGWSQNRMMK